MEKSLSSQNLLTAGVSTERRASDSRILCKSENLLAEPVHYDGLRKHSSGDLHSRLKTRKLLGVGETDDGDVHRSKLSQILGHSEQLYVKLPRGLRIWQIVVAIMFSVMGLWALIFPKNMFTVALNHEADDSTILPTRLYGAALISFAMIFWSTLRATDREVIRWALLSSALYFIIQIIVTLSSSISSLLTLTGLLTFSSTLSFIWLNVFFYNCMSRHTAKEVTGVTLIEMGLLCQMALQVLPHRVISAAISLYYYHEMGVPPVSKARRSFLIHRGSPNNAEDRKSLTPGLDDSKNKDD